MVKKESLSAENSGEKRKPRLRDRLLAPIARRFRSKSPGPSTSTTQTSTLGLTKDDLYVLENLQVLEDTHILPGLDGEIKSMTEAMDRVQQSLPVYPRWVISDNAEELLRNLTSLNNDLFRVLLESESLLAHPANPHRSQGSKLKLSFDIPLESESFFPQCPRKL